MFSKKHLSYNGELLCALAAAGKVVISFLRRNRLAAVFQGGSPVVAVCSCNSKVPIKHAVSMHTAIRSAFVWTWSNAPRKNRLLASLRGGPAEVRFLSTSPYTQYKPITFHPCWFRHCEHPLGVHWAAVGLQCYCHRWHLP